MKKFARILSLTMVALLTTFALADSGLKIDLSSMTFDELVSLQESVTLAIWKSDEWQEVKVPQGTWKVGRDIPEGTWTVKCSPYSDDVMINWGKTLEENGQEIAIESENSYWNIVYNKKIYNAESDQDRQFEYTFTVGEGDYIEIVRGAAIFMPYSGKAPFSFK